MEQRQIDEIIACLPRGRTLYYFKDRYALQLLTYFVSTEKAVPEVKRSSFGGLLRKPLLKEVLRVLPGDRLTTGTLAAAWPLELQTYRLTLGTWGGNHYWRQSWYQTSRPGKNLVLQLNFSNRHNRLYQRLIRPETCHPFLVQCHPVATGKELTLAWARLDVDLKAGEALIEEVQSDWVREAMWRMCQVENGDKDAHASSGLIFGSYPGAPKGSAGDLRIYVEEVLKPYTELWEEAMLSAAIWFLREELGICRIFYHVFDVGNRLKGIRWSRPPRSLYSRLPRRFCFREAVEVPCFLTAHRRVRREMRRGNIRFFLLEL